MAGTIDQLNFEVLLDDKKFSATIEKDLKMAQKLNTDLSSILNLKKQLNAKTTEQIVNAEKVRQAEQKTAQEIAKTALQQQKVKTEVEKTKAAQQGYSGAVQATNAHLLTTSSLMRTLSQLTGITFSVAMVRRFVSSMIEITGQFELQKVALKTILQDADGAERIFEQLYKFSSDSMYRFSELAKHAKQLAAFGIDQDKLLDTTKMLGDVASGLGVSMDRIILAYGHVKSSGFLRGIQLRSFSQNGVPILQELAKMFEEVEGRAVSLGEVFDRMTKRQIDFAMVEEAFRRMTEEGGQFHNIQEQMARTLAGEINVLKGRWENLMYALGQETEGAVLAIVRTVSDAISSLDNFKRTLRDLWDAGSPFWNLVHKGKDALDEWNRNRGKGGATSLAGGGFGPAPGGGDRGALYGGGGSRGEELKEQETVLVKISNIESQIKTEEAEINRLREKAKKEGLDTGLVSGVNEVQLLQNAVDARDEALKEYKSITGEDYYKQRKSGQKTSDQKRKEQIQDLKEQANFLKKLSDAYKKLQPYLGEDTNAKMVEIFGEGDYTKIEEQVELLVVKLRMLGKEGNDAADALEERWGLDEASKLAKKFEADAKAAAKAQKAIDTFEKTMDKWRNKDFNLWGETETERSISKIVSDYKTKENEIEATRKQAIKEAKEAGKYTEQAAKEIDDLAEKNKKYEQTLAQDKISKLAKGYFSFFTENIDMDNLSSKTRDELDNTIKKIEDAKALALAAIDAIADKLEKEGFDVGSLRAYVGRMFDNASDKGKDAKTAKTYAQWQKAASAAAKAANEIAEALGKLAEATSDANLKNLSEAISGNAQAMSSAISGVKEYGGWWGAIIGALEYVGQELLEDEAIWKEVEASIKRSNVTVLLTQMDELLNKSKGSLGESWTMGLRDAVDVMNEMRMKSEEMRQSLGGQTIEKTFNSSLLNPLPLETAIDNLLYKVLGFNANLFSRVNGDWKAYQDALVKGYEGAEAYIVKTQDRNGFLNWLGWDDKYSNLKDLVEGLGFDLYDDYGNLNAKGLQAILDTYPKLDAEDKKWMEDAIAYSEEYAKAMDKIKETVSDLFNNISGTLADDMIEAFKETGNAVDNLSESFEKLGETFVKSMLESAIYETVLGKYEKQMQSLFEEYGKGNMGYTDLLDQVDTMFNNMGTDFEKSADVYNAILDRATDLHWVGDSSESSASNSLGSGIKSITEDTANLLASYINAIRADVSMIRMMQEKGWSSMETLGAAVPTLNDYLNQVAANTFDTAQNTQSILTELRSVIGSQGSSGMVVRVERV